jgi:hypothetical protein
MMNVFADLHHGDLYFSLHRLFEARLGFNLYRPIGLDWFHQGFWKVAEPYGNAMDTVGQYLDINNNGWDQFNNLNGNHYVEDGVYHAFDPGHDYYQKAITLEKFQSMKFDLIVSSIPSHDHSFARLLRQYQPQAKHIAQMGNINQKTGVVNVLHSVPYSPKPGQNAIYYHQEIDPAMYRYEPPNIEQNPKRIYSFVNNLPYRHVYQTYKAALPEVLMESYGGGCPDGAVHGSKGVSEMMRKANIGWHLKIQNGFGHNTMGWFASGRPVITQMKDLSCYPYSDAKRLFEPGVTCINLDHRDVAGNCAAIRQALEPENNLKLAENAYKRFCEVVNYDAETEQIKQFLERALA